MKTQLLREHHNRQDKTRKPDYHVEMAERGRTEQVTTDSSRLLGRTSARDELVRNISKRRFVYRNLSFKFGWNLNIFAKKNNMSLEDEKTKVAMVMVQQAAERDIRAFAERIRTAPIRKRGIVYYFDYEQPQTECELF